MTMSKKNVDEVAIKRDWEERGFSFGIWMDAPGQEWNDYVHRVDELLLLVEGEIELKISGEVLYPQIGEEILIPANVKHSVKNIGKENNRWLYGYKK